MSTRDYNITEWPTLGVNFWGVTKAANSAVKNSLLKSSGYKDFNILDTVSVNKESLSTYITPAQALKNNLINFAVIRHPVSRTLSAYKDLILTRPARGIKAGLPKNCNLDDFFEFISDTDDTHDVHFRSISWFISEPMHYLIKIENNFLDWPFNNIKVPLTIVHSSKTANITLKNKHLDIIKNRYIEDFNNFNYELQDVDYASNQ